jgi:RNA polymerase sigma factor (sigma-70 family)
MNPKEKYLESLRMIERIAACVARRHHLDTNETEEFVQEVRVRLLDNDYAIIRKFEERSSFSTFLTTVIVRLYSQWRVEQWGKWRPSAEARRLGDKAITLERLLTRDGYSLGEAVRKLTTGDSAFTIAELEAIYLRLPPRNPRTVVVPDDAVPDVVSPEPDAYERIEAGDRARTVRHACTKMDEVMKGMDAEDRVILQMRFWDARRVPDIAGALHLDQKKVYKRLDRLFLVLRRELESAGVSAKDVAGLLIDGDEDINLDLLPPPEIPPSGPSDKRGGKKVRGRKGKKP